MGIARRLCGRRFGGRNTKAKLAIKRSDKTFIPHPPQERKGRNL